MSSQEQTERRPENADGSHERPRELGEELKRSPEHYNQTEAHQTAEHARRKAAQGKEKRAHQAAKHNASHTLRSTDREESFEQTMEEVRHDLPRSTRGFSHFIHNPVIERISEVLASTVARPDAILAGGITAFLAVLGLYFYAKYAGFSLQGSETIVAFVIGWLLGVVFDFFKTMFTGKR
jgi:chromatin segregation and condensation protein Rec8/ScpA/Scc1 (kleisin family)